MLHDQWAFFDHSLLSLSVCWRHLSVLLSVFAVQNGGVVFSVESGDMRVSGKFCI